MPAHLRAEALGLAQIEALASGLPCVSTELGTGTSFANRHGETGLVVPPGDAPALAAALNTLLADADMRRRFGAAGRARVAALFTRAHMVDRVEAIYRDVLTRHSDKLAAVSIKNWSRNGTLGLLYSAGISATMRLP